eukprot:Protomagalhaensia_wolfi_Nauph_80__1026@NODE_1595_length_1451_cov_365_698300_g1233_i0_p1_GENE_NODE_1595_length_1451_cov_365_698300_g1233_i0NODE_1595_length_1451_cov_365_698300_g1233_i0_p1_ORF_typecomplete_len416_score72_87Integrin_beta/PF00362_18/7_2e27NDUFB11/PF17250_2/0_055_NODE_1595_length_1451_cov_365_698300_g1233_i01181365
MKFLALEYLLATAVFGESPCYLPIDVLFLQDTTGSFMDDLPNVVALSPQIVEGILVDHPESIFAVTEFRDKPYHPLGAGGDFCYKTQTVFTEDVDVFRAAWGRLFASGGGDLPEASFHAIINAALDSEIGWRHVSRPLPMDPTGMTGARVIIMSTDAVPHVAGDAQRMYPGHPDLPEFWEDFDPDSDPEEQCLIQDYPTPEKVRDVLQRYGYFFVTLTPNNSTIVPAWTWFNEDLLHQPSSFYQFIEADSSDILEGILKAVQAVTEVACAYTTVAPAPATTEVRTPTEERGSNTEERIHTTEENVSRTTQPLGAWTTKPSTTQMETTLEQEEVTRLSTTEELQAATSSAAALSTTIVPTETTLVQSTDHCHCCWKVRFKLPDRDEELVMAIKCANVTATGMPEVIGFRHVQAIDE